MAFKWRELEAMDDEELIAAHDKAAEHTVVGTAYYRDELVHRRQMRAAQAQWEQAEEARRLNERIAVLTDSIRRLTVWLVVLTVAVLIATVVAVVVTSGG